MKSTLRLGMLNSIALGISSIASMSAGSDPDTTFWIEMTPSVGTILGLDAASLQDSKYQGVLPSLSERLCSFAGVIASKDAFRTAMEVHQDNSKTFSGVALTDTTVHMLDARTAFEYRLIEHIDDSIQNSVIVLAVGAQAHRIGELFAGAFEGFTRSDVFEYFAGREDAMLNANEAIGTKAGLGKPNGHNVAAA